MGSAPGFFDFNDRLRRLRVLGDQLEAYGRLEDFEAFQPELDKAFAYTRGAHGGRPPFDPVMMLKGAGDPDRQQSVARAHLVPDQ